MPTPHFCQYSCGFAGFLEPKIQSNFPWVPFPLSWKIKTLYEMKQSFRLICQVGSSALFAFCDPFPCCQMYRSSHLTDRQVDESSQRPKIKPLKYKVAHPFSGTLHLAGRRVFALPLSRSPLNTLPAGKEQDMLHS